MNSKRLIPIPDRDFEIRLGTWIFRPGKIAYFEIFVTETLDGRSHFLVAAPLAANVPRREFSTSYTLWKALLGCVRKVERFELASALWQNTNANVPDKKSGPLRAA
jgi:hypothetical protein